MTRAPAFVSSDLYLIRRNPAVIALASSPLLGALGLVVAGLVSSPAYFALVPHLTIAGVVLAYLAYAKNWRPRVDRVQVEAGGDGVQVGERFVPRAKIRDGLVVPGHPPRVLLHRRRALPVEIQTGGTGEARSLLRALGLDASQTVAHFRALSRVLTKERYSWAVGGGFALFYILAGGSFGRGHHAAAPLMGLLMALGFVAMLVAYFAPTRFDVGADGLALRWLWRRRFLGYDEIEDVSRYHRRMSRSSVCGVRVLLRGGEEVLVPMEYGSTGGLEVAVVEERIREAQEAFRTGGSAADAAVLRRNGRPVGEWISALRSIGAGANADLRTPPVPRDRLFRIVEDPGASAPERAAAAIALGVDLDDDGRARLRTAADATAAPRLRIAIEKAAAGVETAALEAAIVEIEAEEAQHASRAS